MLKYIFSLFLTMQVLINPCFSMDRDNFDDFSSGAPSIIRTITTYGEPIIRTVGGAGIGAVIGSVVTLTASYLYLKYVKPDHINYGSETSVLLNYLCVYPNVILGSLAVGTAVGGCIGMAVFV